MPKRVYFTLLYSLTEEYGQDIDILTASSPCRLPQLLQLLLDIAQLPPQLLVVVVQPQQRLAPQAPAQPHHQPHQHLQVISSTFSDAFLTATLLLVKFSNRCCAC